MKFALACALLFSSASAFTTTAPSHSGVMTSRPVTALNVASEVGTIKQVPHGGDELVNLMLTSDEDKAAAIAKATVTLEASPRQLCDVELIMNGGFSPIDSFMNEETYKNVVENMELLDGTLFGLPVVFDTDDEDLQPGTTILLTQGDLPVATVELTDKYVPNKPLECLKCYGTSAIEHPGSLMVATERGQYYMGGKVTGLNLPVREFPCKTPQEVRAGLPADTDVVAFQCRNPVHRAHYELFTRALDDPLVGEGGIVLVHPTCGPTQADDISGEVRYKTYEVLKEETANPRVQWEYLPYSMHMAGPREAIQHMIIRKNFGCTHFIIGRDMAGSKSSVTGEDFYGAYDAQDFAKENAERLGVQPVPSLNLVYTEEEGYTTADYAKEKGLNTKKLSGTKFRQMLRGGDDIPEWFAFKSVVKVLRDNIEILAKHHCNSNTTTTATKSSLSSSTPQSATPFQIQPHQLELHPGNYTMYDRQQLWSGAARPCQESTVACRVMATVIGNYPDRILLDAGALALSKDLAVPPPINKGGTLSSEEKGTTCSVQGRPDLECYKTSQEMTLVRSKSNPTSFPNREEFPIGSTVFLIPSHSCLAAACFDKYYIVSKADDEQKEENNSGQKGQSGSTSSTDQSLFAREAYVVDEWTPVKFF